MLLNAATTFAQVIGSAVALFFLYRFLIRTIGIEQLGIWSLVLATTSVVTLANQGFSASIVKFVAKYAAWNRSEDVSVLIQTAVISMGLALGVFALALYPGAKWILKSVIPAGLLGEALAILPYAFATLWLNVVGGIFLAGLAGYELITQKNYVLFAQCRAVLGILHWIRSEIRTSRPCLRPTGSSGISLCNRLDFVATNKSPYSSLATSLGSNLLSRDVQIRSNLPVHYGHAGFEGTGHKNTSR